MAKDVLCKEKISWVMSRVRLRFTNTVGGLAVHWAEQFYGFAVAGIDRIFHEAEARIDRDFGDSYESRCPYIRGGIIRMECESAMHSVQSGRSSRFSLPHGYPDDDNRT